MQVSSEKKEGIKHLLTVTVPADDVKKAYQVSFVKYAKNAKIDGFRKGHIPTNVLEQQFGSQIFADVLSIQPIQPEAFSRSYRQGQIYIIGPPTLFGDFPPKIPEPELKDTGPASGLVVLDSPIVPEYVIVHDGVPNNVNAPNFRLPYRDYIKNVASSEIFPTWPRSTIEANVLAIVSFTLNRVYTEWYRNQGKNFTITSSTAYDHAFFNGRNIFDSISRVVDDLFSTYILRTGHTQPLLTQYCDGVQVQCPTWMSLLLKGIKFNIYLLYNISR